jgi:peptide/nickel transport system permease protein
MLAGVSVVLFALMRLAPGGPEAVLIGGEFSQEVAAQVRERLGLDRPLPAQYGSWVLAALQGDLGRSFKTGDPVLTLILDRLGPTLQLTGGALALAFLVAVPYAEFSKILMEDAPYVFLYFPQQVYVTRQSYDGFVPVPAYGGIYQSLKNVKLTGR